MIQVHKVGLYTGGIPWQFHYSPTNTEKKTKQNEKTKYRIFKSKKYKMCYDGVILAHDSICETIACLWTYASVKLSLLCAKFHFYTK